ncbi:MAG: trypsin-like peptidase domain-containing protein [Desulfurococcaceae archaeon]
MARGLGLRELSREIAEVVARVRQSVVTVSTLVEVPLLLFGHEEVQGFGSGLVISPGLVVTNAHVVRGASRLSVTFHDGYSSAARVVAADPSRDLALVECDKHGSPIDLGDSDRLEVGEIVLAIGSPLGIFGHSVTMGVVSAVGRTIAVGELILEDLIQTDAAINPGNSGGPLVDLEAKAVGVTTAMVPFAQGIGFAIPINSVKRFVQMIERYGRPLRAWIGVYVAPLNPTLASMYGIATSEGLLVVRVVRGSPAARSGIREGDVLLAADGRQLRRTSDLREAIEEGLQRGFVELEVLRGGSRRRVEVEIAVEEL